MNKKMMMINPNSMSLLFCMIEVRRGCSVRRRTSRLEMRWYQRISRILLRHHWSRSYRKEDSCCLAT